MLDVSPEMRRLIIKLTREKRPEWKLKKVLDYSEELKQLRLRAQQATKEPRS